jgi:hypothetical protein
LELVISVYGTGPCILLGEFKVSLGGQNLPVGNYLKPDLTPCLGILDYVVKAFGNELLYLVDIGGIDLFAPGNAGGLSRARETAPKLPMRLGPI